MPSASAVAKENESLERRLESKDKKLERIMSRGMFVGGVIGGAALGAMIDLRFGSIWGFQPSTLFAAVGITLVMTDKVPKKHEEMVLALALGMVAKPVYEKTVETLGKGAWGKLFGDGGENVGEG